MEKMCKWYSRHDWGKWVYSSRKMVRSLHGIILSRFIEHWRTRTCSICNKQQRKWVRSENTN
jgi:hypothetical protein